MDGVVVCTENDGLRMVIGVNDIAAGATGDQRRPDDDGEIDAVELQLGGSSNGHLGEIDDEGFCLGSAAGVAGVGIAVGTGRGVCWLRGGSCDDDRLSGCCGCGGGDDGANVKLGVAWQGADEGLSLLDQLLLIIRRGVAFEDGIGEGLLGLLC